MIQMLVHITILSELAESVRQGEHDPVLAQLFTETAHLRRAICDRRDALHIDARVAAFFDDPFDPAMYGPLLVDATRLGKPDLVARLTEAFDAHVREGRAAEGQRFYRQLLDQASGELDALERDLTDAQDLDLHRKRRVGVDVVRQIDRIIKRHAESTSLLDDVTIAEQFSRLDSRAASLRRDICINIFGFTPDRID